VLLETGWLKTELGIELAPDKLAQITIMDNPGNMDELANLGRLAASSQVTAEHLSSAFDIV
jgi:uncharacterized protein